MGFEAVEVVISTVVAAICLKALALAVGHMALFRQLMLVFSSKFFAL